MARKIGLLAMGFVVCLTLIVASEREAHSGEIVLTWTASTGNVEGYRVFWRLDGQEYDYQNPDWEGSENICRIYGLEDCQRYHFVVYAFNNIGISDPSDELTLDNFCNSPPTACTGENQAVNEDIAVVLDGSCSSDLDGDIAFYLWTQISGPQVNLSSATAVQSSFITPSEGDTQLMFELLVTDSVGQYDVAVTVVDVTRGFPDIPGDVNSDLVKNSNDYSFILQNRLKPITDYNRKCDINVDGKIDNVDVLLWRQIP